MEKTELLFDEVIFDRVRMQLVHVTLPKVKILRVLVTENGVIKRHEWGDLPHGYNYFAAVKDMFLFKAKTLMDDEVKRTRKSPKELELEAGYAHFKHFADNMA